MLALPCLCTSIVMTMRSSDDLQVEPLDLPAAFQAISQSIVAEYVMRRSPNYVSLPEETRFAILDAHSQGAVPVSLLIAEQQKIFNELEQVTGVWSTRRTLRISCSHRNPFRVPCR